MPPGVVPPPPRFELAVARWTSLYVILHYITQEGERRNALLSYSVNNGTEFFIQGGSVDNSAVTETSL